MYGRGYGKATKSRMGPRRKSAGSYRRASASRTIYRKKPNQKLMEAHGKKMSPKHMEEMRRLMRQGHSFGKAHTMAMRRVGK